MNTRIPKVSKYEHGLNEYLDILLEGGEVIWRVNGDRGLRPIEADTEEEAKAMYLAIPKREYY